MMRVLADSNILLDALGNRQPFAAAALALCTKHELGQLQVSLTATTVTTIFYVLRKQIGRASAHQAVADLLATYDVCSVDTTVLRAAVAKSYPDFEDAVQDAAAELAGISVIVTRDARGFAGSTRRIVDAATLVQELDAQQQSP
ncbi:MAG: PIN domain-containing protein [Gemmataceae bacterium]|nr:PIN domain-containing protein [Gemmataceae bacterium]